MRNVAQNWDGCSSLSLGSLSAVLFSLRPQVSELKLAVNSRARVVAHTFLKQFC